MVKAIVGANWGDEGKGKITDLLAEASDVVIRFQGGANAGHTIICDYGKFALHQLPSGVFYPHVTNVIGNGVALDVKKFLAELRHLADGGVPAPRVIVDQRTQLLMSYHVLLDTYEEERLAGEAFGSTHSGIAPFYSDKYAKIGIQVCDLFDEKRLMERLEQEQRQIEQKIKLFLGDSQGAENLKYRVSWSNVDTQRVDSRRLKEEQPDVYSRFAKVSHSRRFTVKAA